MQDGRSVILKLNADISYRFPITTDRDDVNAKRLQYFIDATSHPFERSTLEGHVTGTAFIVDNERQHTLLLRHKKLNMWLPPGGHCDGNADIIDTVLRETQEETGIADVNVVSNEILDIDIHLIPANPKEPEHYHYDIRFLLQADRHVPLVINEQEATNLQWISIDRLEDYTQLPSLLILREKMEVL
ncbi:NUDIX hydrolase [Pectobacterium carotovorum]|uniref:NUDIX hydrolase n=1 Tax=Pectobacterium carotovorum TaxID=554 RepID=UPI0029DC04D3|nr:NUDIX hydrolase [Pectobacterium carotovorum]MDX6916481.1 NUDIX hydrolase [Pectobacterium carotovorum]